MMVAGMTNTLHIYTRVSSLIQQEEGTSLENQKQLGIKKSIELGFDYQVWNEGGQSSFNDDLTNRPVIVKLLSLIENGTVKHLFVYNTDRLSRNQQTWGIIRYRLLKHGVILHTSTGQMTLSNPVDDLMLGILSEISQYDNRIRAERSRLGRFQKVQQGNWKGGPAPFGYFVQNKQLQIDPFESEWIKTIFNLYCDGKSVKEIQKTLISNGVMTRRGNSNWSIGTIQTIIRNPLYSGFYNYTDKLIGETVQVKTPAIIDPDLYKLSETLRTRRHTFRNLLTTTKNFYLLKGVLVCGHCGRLMGGRINKVGYQNFYYCVNRERTWSTRLDDQEKWKRGSGCLMIRSVNIGKTDSVVWDIIKTVHLQFQELQIELNKIESPTINNFTDRSEMKIVNFMLMSLDEIDSLMDQERKVIVNTLLSKVSVFYDKDTGKHSLEVEFTGCLSKLLMKVSKDKMSSELPQLMNSDDPVNNDSETDYATSGYCPKKSWNKWVQNTHSTYFSVTVE